VAREAHAQPFDGCDFTVHSSLSLSSPVLHSSSGHKIIVPQIRLQNNDTHTVTQSPLNR